jgi:6-O-methylguanine DNA methyltransferase, DNA binding domain
MEAFFAGRRVCHLVGEPAAEISQRSHHLSGPQDPRRVRPHLRRHRSRAPRLVGGVLATTHDGLPWHRVVRADGSLPQGQKQRELLVNEGVPMRGEGVELREPRLPPEL